MPWNQKRVVARTTPILHRYHTTIPISLTHPNDSSPFIIFKGIISLVKLNLYGCNNGASIKWTHWWLGGDSSGMTHPPINKKRVEERGEVYESSTQLVYTVWSLEWITWTLFFQFPRNPWTEQWQITVRNFESRSRDVEHTHPRNFSYSQCRG